VTDRLFKSLFASTRKALSDKNIEEAERLTSRLLETYPGEAASHGFRLELLLSKRQLQEAERLAKRLIIQFPSSAGIWFNAGSAAFRLKRYPEARRRFEESEKLFSSVKAQKWLAKCLVNMGCFDDAEAMLQRLVDADPYCGADFAWLYERKGDIARARKAARDHLSRFPNDRLVRDQVARLDAVELDPKEVIAQVALLVDFGEAVPDALVSQYVAALAAVGDSDGVRRFIAEEKAHLGRAAVVNLAWTCHRLQLHDMAYDLFVLVWEQHLLNFKLLNTLDYSARCTGRALELAALYEAVAPRQPELWGRIKKLKAAAGKGREADPSN